MSSEVAFPVVERFVSINGEGLRAGRLSAFIRMAGCNLACSWCFFNRRLIGLGGGSSWLLLVPKIRSQS